jgi:N-glycosidase YbiA
MAFRSMQRDFEFSNFDKLDIPILYQGIIFHTVENFYQAMKNKDIDYRIECSKVHPAQSKKLGKTVELREDWDQVKDDVMLYALRKKFANVPWKQRLLDYNKPIVEYNYWHDNYWGHCLCDNCTSKQHINKLGQLLNQVKQELENEIKNGTNT